MKLVVGVSDMKISNDPNATLVTYSLGSCIGVALFDPSVMVGGLLHYMLPESRLDLHKAEKNPAMFADTGIPNLFREAYKLGAKKQRMKVVIVGLFNIAKRNHTAVRRIFWKNKVMTHYEDVGGNVNRTVRIEIATGNISVNVAGKGEKTV